MVVTAGAEFAVDAAGASQRLVDDPDALLPGGIRDQYGFHGFASFFFCMRRASSNTRFILRSGMIHGAIATTSSGQAA